MRSISGHLFFEKKILKRRLGKKIDRFSCEKRIVHASVGVYRYLALSISLYDRLFHSTYSKYAYTFGNTNTAFRQRG